MSFFLLEPLAGPKGAPRLHLLENLLYLLQSLSYGALLRYLGTAEFLQIFFLSRTRFFFRARLFGGGPAGAGPPPKSLARKKNRVRLRKKSAKILWFPGYRRSVSYFYFLMI